MENIKIKFFFITCFFVTSIWSTCQVSNQYDKARNDSNCSFIKPVKAESIATCNSIQWNWHSCDNGIGHRYNFENDFPTSINIDKETSFLQEGLIGDEQYKLFVWAYNDSCISEVLILEQKTAQWTCGCKFIDKRDMQTYSTVAIGKQCWMAQNLNFKSELESSCYNDNDTLCNIYGRFYSFEAAMQSCPQGWKLPTLDETEQLMKFVADTPEELYDKLVGRDSSGFAMKLGGFCDPTSSEPYRFIGKQAGIWTSSAADKNSNHIVFFGNTLGCRVMKGDTNLNYYVRCIKE
ncbi:MAG: FISUMP domain-containing protein [Bacteroidales bacterium]|nr:FISUMP domain-containing protein [Bacteroidales bacterium]